MVEQRPEFIFGNGRSHSIPVFFDVPGFDLLRHDQVAENDTDQGQEKGGRHARSKPPWGWSDCSKAFFCHGL
jgi:hypothetical protein